MNRITELQQQADTLRARSFLPRAEIKIESADESGVVIVMNLARWTMTPDWTPATGVKAPYIKRVVNLAA